MRHYIKHWVFISIFLLLFLRVHAGEYRTETVYIPIKYENLRLLGVLNIPDSFVVGKPLIVLVSSPQPYNCNKDGLFKFLADSLSSNGIATFRFNNRAFTDSLKADSKDPDRFTISDGAEDLGCIISTLKSDPRFKKSRIGLLGQSEGGCITAVVASSNKEIDFLIVTSTIGTKGEYLSYNQVAASFDRAFPILMTLGNFRNLLQRSSFYIPYNISRAKDIDEAKSEAYKDIVDFIDSCTEEDKKQFLGKDSSHEWAQKSVELLITPRAFELIRFNPEDYYTKISCPVLAVYGTEDEKFDYQTQMYALERLFFLSNKMNYQMLWIENADHFFRDYIPCGTRSRRDMEKEEEEEEGGWNHSLRTLTRYITRWVNNDFIIESF